MKILISVSAAVLLSAALGMAIAPFTGSPVRAEGTASLEKATFAGGCFWCMEPPFEKLEGVKSVVSGYTGGTKENPTYEEVSSGRTGHVEAVEVTYDPAAVSYEELLDVFWRQIDPTDEGGQFVDRGSSYLTAIFTHSEEQRLAAERSRTELERSGRFAKPIVTPIRSAGPFYPAEDYHQDYYKTHPIKYKYYRWGSGRDRFLEKAWGAEEAKKMKTGPETGVDWRHFSRPSDEELRRTLTPMQYRVIRENGTEPAYSNEMHANKRAGIYVDLVSGEPLFSSTDKYDSKSGWPSFTRPLAPENIVEKSDRSFFMTRTEVRSRHGDSHLGHVFDDGPKETGKRYCINAAALRFVPSEDLEREGYGEYSTLFR